MHFAKWMTFLTSVICAIYGMSPAEINFDSFSGGATSPLAGSDTEQKLAASKDSGLRPLLAYYENTFSDVLISEFSPQLGFRWTGLDPEDGEKKHELRKLILTVDEVRAQEGDEAHPDPDLGSAPLNPSLMSVYNQKMQAAMQPQQDFGQPGEQGKEQPGEQGKEQPESNDEPDFGAQDEQQGDFDGTDGQPDFGQPQDSPAPADAAGDSQLDFGKAFPAAAPVVYSILE